MIQIGAQSFTSLAQLQQRVTALANAARGEGRRRGTEAAANRIAEEARRRAPRSTQGAEEREGRPRAHLADTIGVRFYEHSAARTRYGIGTDDPVGLYAEAGTAPHEIRPRRAGALWWPNAAHPVARVSHPGTQPRPWLKPAADDAIGDALRLFGDVFAQAVREGVR